MVFAIIDLIGNLFIRRRYEKYSTLYPIFKNPELAREEECRKEQKDKRFSCLFRDMAIQILWSVASKD
jgi:hypothetical protein